MNSVLYLVIVILLIIDALVMAYRTAVMSLTDGDLSDSDDEEVLIREPARSRIREVRDNGSAKNQSDRGG